MKQHIAIAALFTGVMFASAPAFAQHYGRGVNDGGTVDEPNTPAPKVIYNSAAPTTPHYGRSVNDGGMVDQPSAAQMAAAKNIKWAQSQPHYGRALDDGGF